MDAKTFRASPLSDQVVASLTHAAMAQSEWKAILTFCEPSDATKDLLALIELYHHATHNGLDCDFDDALLSLYTDKPTSRLAKDIHVLRECMSYAKHRVFEIKAITAADLLKINLALIDSDTTVLKNDNLSSEILVNDVWSILHDLYNPDKRYPLLLKAAIAAYRLLTLQPQWKVDLWTLRVLFEAVYPEDLETSGISMQWLMLVDPEKSLSAYDTESAILLILSVLEGMWRKSSGIYLAIRNKESEILNTIHELLPKLRGDRILSALTRSVCLSNASFREKTGVSHGTAVNHLKDAESARVLYSKMDGRERLYFNKIICGFAREQMRVM